MIHLHCHSMYSLRDSIIRPNELADRLIELNQSAIAITDHGSSLGGISIYKILKSKNIKYIHGCEVYICDDLTIKNKESKYNHLVLLCKNENARVNLNKLISISELSINKYFRPRIDFDLLSKYGDDFIVLSACLAGEISKALCDNDYILAKNIALKYKNRFKNNYYLEIQARNDVTQIEINKKIIKLANELKIELVVTTDAHYVRNEDKKYQNKYAFNGSYKENDESYVGCYIQSEDEIRHNLDYLDNDIINKCIYNTHVISDMCIVEMPLSAPIMPHVDTPMQYKNNRQWISDLCIDGFKNKLNIDFYNQKTYDTNKFLKRSIYNKYGEFVKMVEFQLTNDEVKNYIERYNYELDSLDRMGFIDYILLVYSYSNVANRKGIARGSAGGSLICYLSNITNIDPIEHGLYFERFIDVSALELLETGQITKNELKIPDIDLDFSGESCKSVLKFLYNKYGEQNVASIGRFGNNKTKGTIRDMCKVFDIDLQTEDKISKAFEGLEIEDIDYMIKENKILPNAKKAVNYVFEYTELFEYIRKLIGLPKSFGLHPCGRIVSTRDIDYFLPSCYDENGIRYLQGDMHDVEDVGLVKADVLGLRTLDQEYETLEMSTETIDFINPKTQDFYDNKVMDIFRNGNTIGIFQFSSYGMRETLKKMNVSNLEDLSIANALYRPGAMSYIDNFCNRRDGSEKIEYLHEDLIPILKNTYGIIVFQEQLIEIGRLAGLRNPDLLRQATAKKKESLMNQIYPELKEKLLKRNWTEQQFEKLWDDMIEFSRYSFNKCISGETKIQRLGYNSTFQPTIEEMYKIKNDKNYAIKTNHYHLYKKYNRYGYGNALSMFDDNKIRNNSIIDIRQSGTQKTYKVTTQSNASIVCTMNHKFPTRNGEKKLIDLHIGDLLYVKDKYKKNNNKKYNLTDGNFIKNIPIKGRRGFQKINNGNSVVFKNIRKSNIKNKNSCEICKCLYNDTKRFELHHKNGDRTNNSMNNLQWCCASCHKKEDYKIGRTKVFENGLSVFLDTIISIEFIKEEMTYDIEMKAPAHNFISDSGLIVSNSHSSAYALLAFLTAKQKAYYPKEFFTGLLNSYIGESNFVKNNASEILNDMQRNKVYLNPLKFGKNNIRCNIENNRINYAIPLIKDCNVDMAKNLYSISNNKYNSFVDLLYDMKKLSINKGQLLILIKLDYFSMFGNAKELLQINDMFVFFKFGDAKSINKEKISEKFMYDIINKYSESKNKKGEDLKSFKIIDCKSILHELEIYIYNLKMKDFSIKEKTIDRMTSIGFVIGNGKEEDRPKLIVKDIWEIYKRKDKSQCGYSIVTQSIGSSIQSRFTIFNNVYEKCGDIYKNDFILCKNYKINNEYFTMLDYEKIL